MKSTSPQITDIDLGQIKTNGGTQPRSELNPDVVATYLADMHGGASFPPVVLFYDGSDYWLGDGFHRYQAKRSSEAKTISAEVHQGTRRDAVLYSVGANATHGLPRTNADKRRAVMTLMGDAEWGKWSDREIARQCGVSHPFVSSLRPETPVLSGNRYQIDQPASRTPASAERTATRNGTTYTINTSKIGAVAPRRVDASTAQTAVLEKDSEFQEKEEGIEEETAELDLYEAPIPRRADPPATSRQLPSPPQAIPDDEEIDPDTGEPYPEETPFDPHAEAVNDPEYRATKLIGNMRKEVIAFRDNGVLRDLKKTDNPSRERAIRLIRQMIEDFESLATDLENANAKAKNNPR